MVIKGLIKRNENIIIMLDLERILTVEEEDIIFRGEILEREKRD